MTTPDTHPLLDETLGPAASADLLAGEHPADVAEAIAELSPEHGVEVLAAMPAADAAEALREMELEQAQAYVEELPAQVAAAALAEMAPDDAADLLGELPLEKTTEILRDFPEAERAELQTLMAYPPESAGGIMSPEVVALDADLTAPEAIAELRRMAEESEQIYYTYVVDHQHRLVGVLSLRDLLLAPSGARLHEIMRTRIVSVPLTMDREEVATMLSRYGYYALPVTADDGRLLGLVTIDDVMEVLQEEATEDMQVMVGAGADERVDSPLARTLYYRVPWLIVNLGTAFLAAAVVGIFESELERLTVLAVLLPVVAGMAGNGGAQSMAVVIRGIALGETRGLAFGRLLGRHVAIGAATGVVIGVIAGGAAWLWWADMRLALVLALAMLACMLIAAVTGALVPWTMKRLGFDPAQSSNIIMTTVTDVTGFGIFLALGVWWLS